jgi:hypothetical protein
MTGDMFAEEPCCVYEPRRQEVKASEPETIAV